MKHYFTDNHTHIKNRKEISFRFLNVDYSFDTAEQVFSKDRVDMGSEILLKNSIDHILKGPVLDYGCGYGPIGIVLAKEGFKVCATDITERAMMLTKENAEKNKVKLRVCDLEDEIFSQASFNTVLLNPPIRTGKKNIFEMYQNAFAWLKNAGRFFIVIRKQHGAKSSVRELEKYFSEVEVLNKEKGYWVVLAIK